MDALKFLINLKGIDLSPEDRLGGTPLADAIRHKHQEAQKMLRDRGAQLGSMDVSVRLCEAGASNDLDALKTYVRNGADLNAGDYDQRTALHLAASKGHLAAVSWILDNGVDVNVNVLDRMKRTPLDDANTEGHKAGGGGEGGREKGTVCVPCVRSSAVTRAMFRTIRTTVCVAVERVNGPPCHVLSGVKGASARSPAALSFFFA